MFVFKIFKTLLKTLFIFIFGCFIFFNIPHIQKKIINEVVKYSNEKNNFTIKFDDCYIKYFHIIALKNLRIQKKDATEIITSTTLEININPIKILFNQTISFNNIFFSSIKCDFTKILQTKSKNEKKNVLQRILDFFIIEINNLQILKSEILIDENIHFLNVNMRINTVLLSKKYITCDIGSLECLNKYLKINSLKGNFIFYFFKKNLFVKQIFIGTNYGSFEGAFNLNNVDYLLNKNFKNIILNIKTNNAILKINEFCKNKKLKNNISDILFNGELNIKNNTLESKNITLKYLQSFSDVKISATNIFDYEKIKYLLNCKNCFFVFSDFKKLLNIKENKILNEIKSFQGNYNFDGDLNICKIFGTSIINNGEIDFDFILHRKKPSQDFLVFSQMEGKAAFKNNNLNFIINDFLNINSELKFNFDFLQNTHQGSLNVKKIQYKNYFLENIKYKWEYNKQNFNGHILSECDILKCNLIHDYLFFNENNKINIYGSINSKKLLNIVFKKNIFNMQDFKFNIQCELNKKNDNIDFNLDIDNLYFCFLNYKINNEKINLQLKLYDNNLKIKTTSNFYDIYIDSIPVNIFKKINWENKNIYELLNNYIDFGNHKINTKFVLKNDLFFNHLLKNKIVLKNININGILENKNKELSYVLKCYCNDDFLFYKKEIKNLNFDVFLNIKKDKNNGLIFVNKIKSGSFYFMRDKVSFINVFRSEKNLFGFSLKLFNGKQILDTQLNFKKDNNFFCIDFEENNNFLKICEKKVILNGGLKINTKNIIFQNFKINYMKNKETCYLNGFFDLKGRKIQDFAVNCSNIKLKYFNFIFDKNFDGVLNCNINNSQYDISIKKTEYEKIKYGDIFFNGCLKKNNYKINFSLIEENQEQIKLHCSYKDNKIIDSDIALNNFNIFKISPLTKNFFESFSGFINGNFKIVGSLDSPQFIGAGKLSKGFIKIKYLKSKIKNISSDITCDKNKIILKNIKAIGNKTSEIRCIGEFLFKKLTKPEIFFKGHCNNFLLVNNYKYECPFFYGIGYMSGDFKISGPFDKIYIDADISTNSSDLYFFTENTNENENIHIVNSKIDFINDSIFGINKKKKSSVFLDLKFNISKDLKLNLDLNETNKISTRGIGNIKINTDCKKDFQIFGTYTISEGNYDLNIYNIFHKHFTIQNGSVLNFYGDINSSKLDINAESLVEDVQCGQKKQDLQIKIHFSENFFNPAISFSIKTLSGKDFGINKNDNLQQFINIIFFKSLNLDESFGENANRAIDNYFSSELSSLIKESLLNKISNNKFNFDFKITNILNNTRIKDKVKYSLSYKITDNLLFYKYGNFLDFDTLMKNMAFKYLFNNSCSALFTIYPTGEELENYNKKASLGFVFEI